MAEELTVLVNAEASPSAKPAAKYEDLSREFQIKGSVFEGLFAAMKRSVLDAEALIHNYCFKRRGKLSETECKQGVGMTLERMANEIWKLVSVQVQKPVSVRAAEALKALLHMQQDSNSLVLKLKQAQSHFEEVLKRYQSISSQESALVATQGESSLGSDSSSSDHRPNPFTRDLSSELRDQGSHLISTFRKHSVPGKPLIGPAVKTEVASIFKDMGLLAKNPKIEGLKAREKGNNLAKEIDRMRIRVEEICRMMEDSSGKKSTDINRIENGKLREIVAKQAEEIEKLRRNMQQFPVDFIDTSDPQTPIAAGQPTSTLFKSSTPDPVMFQISSSPSLPPDRLIYEHQSYQISPAEPISFKEDLDKLTQGQVTMMSDLKNLHKALENITGNPTIPQGNSVSAVSEGNASLLRLI